MGAVGVAEVEVRGLRAEDVLTDVSRVLLFSFSRLLATGALGGSNVLLPQLRQHLTSVGDPELLRIIRRSVRLQP
jgi:hypothetical protein